MEVANVSGGLVFVIFAVPIAAEALAAGVLSAGVATIAGFKYLKEAK